MTIWNGETETQATTIAVYEKAATGTSRIAARQGQLEELFDLYDKVMIDSLLKRHSDLKNAKAL